MLRLLVLLLLLLNGVYFVWAQGWLLPYGWGPMVQREPQRLDEQIEARSIALLTPQEAARQQAASQKTAISCLQSEWLDATHSAALRRTLEANLPATAWSLTADKIPERWIIYMGKYANLQELAKKRAQLAQLNLTFEPLGNASLNPGLSLGAFESQAKANAALEALAQRGVRTARVLLEQPATPGWRLLLPAVDDAVLKKLPPIKVALNGKVLQACAQEAIRPDGQPR